MRFILPSEPDGHTASNEGAPQLMETSGQLTPPAPASIINPGLYIPSGAIQTPGPDSTGTPDTESGPAPVDYHLVRQLLSRTTSGVGNVVSILAKLEASKQYTAGTIAASLQEARRLAPLAHWPTRADHFTADSVDLFNESIKLVIE